MRRSKIVIVCTIAIGIVAVAGFFTMAQLYFQKDLYPVNKMRLGSDYTPFYNATKRIIGGGSPYEVFRYLSPPVPAYMNYFLVKYSWERAQRIMFFLVTGIVIAGYILSSFVFFRQDARLNLYIILFGLVIILHSYPFHFLADRCNIDGFVLFLVIVSVASIHSSQYISGAFLAFAVSMKVYPVILIAPLFLMRKYKVCCAFVAVMLILYLLNPQVWHEYINERLLQRSVGFFRVYENGSMVCALYCLGALLQKLISFADLHIALRDILKSSSLFIYIVLFTCCIAGDWYVHRKKGFINVKEEKAALMLYFPFMVAMPYVVYHYELTALLFTIPVLCFVSIPADNRETLIVRGLFVGGMILSQTNAVVANKLFDSYYAYSIPAFGLFFYILGVVGFKLMTARVVKSKEAIASSE